MITPTDQQITEAFQTSNTAYTEEKELTRDGEKFASSLLGNEQFKKAVNHTSITTIVAGTPGLQAGLMRAFLAGFEAGKVVANQNAGAGTGKVNQVNPNMTNVIPQPRC